MFGKNLHKETMEQLKQEISASLLETEKRVTTVFSYAEDRFTEGLSLAENRSAANLSDIKETLSASVSEAIENIGSLFSRALSDAEEKFARLIAATEEKIIDGLPNAEMQWRAPLVESERRLAARLSEAESRLDDRLREAEERLFATLPESESRLAGLLSGAGEKLAADLADAKADIAALFPGIAEESAKIEENPNANFPDLETKVASLLSGTEEKMSGGLSHVEKNLAERLAAVEEKLFSRFAATEERVASILSELEEKSEQQSVVLADQVRHRDDSDTPQSAVETLLQNQNQILDTLNRMEKTQPVDALISFAEKFAMTQPGMAQPGRKDDSARALAGPFDDLLSCFGLTLVTDLGKTYNSSRHIVARTRYDPAWPEDIILEITEPGFLQGKKLLRPATVVINRPVAASRDEKKSMQETPLIGWQPGSDISPEYADIHEDNRKKNRSTLSKGVKGFFIWLLFGIREPNPKSGRHDTDRKKQRRP